MTTLLRISFLFLFVATFAAGVYLATLQPTQTQPLDASTLQLSSDAVDKAFDQIPDSVFKSNMLIVLGAHLQGPETDAEVNKILSEYALFKLEQMENGNK